jgi:hypothetical protein
MAGLERAAADHRGRGGPGGSQPQGQEAAPVAPLLEQDLDALCLPLGRRVGMPGHATARHYLRRRMVEIGLQPLPGLELELPYRALHPLTKEPCRFCNLVGVIPRRGLPPEAALRSDGRPRAAPAPLLLGAHYDSVIDAPCADDNAAAVALCLAIAAEVRQAPLERDLIIAIFDAEEPPFFLTPAMGSLRWWQEQGETHRPAAAVILDLVGHDVEIRPGPFRDAAPAVPDLLFAIGAESHPEIRNAVEHTAALSAAPGVVLAPQRCIGDLSDYHAFRTHDVPYLFLSCGRGEHYHRASDTIEWLNLAKVRRIERWLLRVLQQLAGRQLGCTALPCDTSAAEARLLRAAFGGFIEQMLMAQGLAGIQHSRDVEMLVYMLRNTYFI